MKVPFSDLKGMHSEIKDELQTVFERVLDESTFVLGPEVRNFEKEFAAYCGTTECIAVNSGTAALHLALLALGVGAGDEVVTVSHTFVATAEAISATGARPVLVDVDPVSYTMDPALLEAAITSKTRAIIPVHLYGQMADMAPILEIAGRHGIPILEDACQAHGAEYKGRRAGSIGRAGCFSFFPGKNLGALGEGGAVTTDDAELARSIRMWRDHGSSRKYEHHFPAFNMRMNGLQGGFLSVKLKHLDRWTERRRSAAAEYDAALADAGVTVPVEMAYGKHVYHLYVIQSDNRDELKNKLAEAGIDTGLHYPTPVHLQEAYRSLGYGLGSFPVTEKLVGRILSLPIFHNISAEAVARVAAEVREFSAAALTR